MYFNSDEKKSLYTYYATAYYYSRSGVSPENAANLLTKDTAEHDKLASAKALAAVFGVNDAKQEAEPCSKDDLLERLEDLLD